MPSRKKQPPIAKLRKRTVKNVKPKLARIRYWWQTRISGSSNKDSTSEALFAIGATGVIEEKNSLVAYFDLGSMPTEKILRNFLEDRLGKAVSVTIDKMKSQDWESEWKKNFKPRKISKKFVVRPSWEKYRSKIGEHVLIIDPKMSFGTGTHETTQLVLRLLESRNIKKQTILDAGTGTGILSIAASKLGAKAVYAFDIDEDSFINSKENIELNTCTDRVSVSLSSLQSLPAQWPKVYDGILANIQRSVLVDLLQPFRQRLSAKGFLILSGILMEENGAMLELFKANDLTPTRIDQDGEWMAYLLEHLRI